MDVSTSADTVRVMAPSSYSKAAGLPPNPSELSAEADWKQKLSRQSLAMLQELEESNEACVAFDDVVTAQHERMEEEKKKEKQFLLMPTSPYLVTWRVLMVVLVIVTVVISPLDMAYAYSSFFKDLKWLMKTIDVLFIIDMAITFNVAQVHHGRLETNRRRIAKTYLRTWFVPDLLINFPWDLIFNENGKYRKIAKMLKLPKALRVIRLLRVAGEQAHYVGTVATLCGILLAGHYSACLWIALLIECSSAEQCPDMMTSYTQAFAVGIASMGGSDSWLGFRMDSLSVMTDDDGLRQKSTFVWDHGSVSHIVASLSCLAGFCLLAVLFSNIHHAMDQRCHNTRLFHSRLANIKASIQQHDIPHSLYDRVKKHYYYVWSCGSDTSKSLLADDALSLDLKRRLAYAFYGHLLRRVPFLESSSPAFLRQLCMLVEMEIFAAGDTIASAGEYANTLYFVAAGSVQIVLPAASPDDEDDENGGTVISVLREGSFFGELGLLYPESQHTVNLEASTAGWLLTIPSSTLQTICSAELLDMFRSVALERVTHHGQLSSTPSVNLSVALVPPPDVDFTACKAGSDVISSSSDDEQPDSPDLPSLVHHSGSNPGSPPSSPKANTLNTLNLDWAEKRQVSHTSSRSRDKSDVNRQKSKGGPAQKSLSGPVNLVGLEPGSPKAAKPAWSCERNATRRVSHASVSGFATLPNHFTDLASQHRLSSVSDHSSGGRSIASLGKSSWKQLDKEGDQGSMSLSDLASRMDAGFEQVNASVSGLAERLGKIEEQLVKLQG